MIRKAVSSDIPSIMKLVRACATHMIAKNIFQWNEFYPNPDAFENDIQREELYVLENEKSLIGCIVISTQKDAEYEEIKWLTSDTTNVYIHRLAVHPDHQSKGHARAMMDFAEEKAREMKAISVRLDTFSQNLRNQKFYESRGYSRLGNIYFPQQSEHPFYCYELIL